MTMTTSTTSSSILFKREIPKIGDLSVALRAIELTRIANPDAHLIVQCSNPDLLMNHPAIDSVLNWETAVPPADVTIHLNAIQQYDEPKHKTFCDVTSAALVKAGLEPIKWDSVPQRLWTAKKDTAWAQDMLMNNVPPGKIPIGMFWRSDQDFRTWKNMKSLASLLVSSGKHYLFCFDGSERFLENSSCLLNIVGHPLNRVCALVELLRLVITPDSGGLHLAGGLGLPFIGLFGATDPRVVASIYRGGTCFVVDCRYHPCWFNHRCVRKRCLKDITPERVMEIVEQKAPYMSILPKLWGLPDKRPKSYQQTILVVRFRGIGDVGLSWFALPALRKKYPDAHITYLTSPMAAAMFCGQEGLVDRVLVSDYRHPASPGVIPIPVDTSSYDLVFNTINAVDFGSIAYKKPRADNFADLLRVSIEPSPHVRPLVISEDEKAWARGRINYEPGNRVVTFQLDSMGLSRFWADHHWLKLAQLLYDYYGPDVKVVFVSIKGRHRGMKAPQNVFNLACETSVREYFAIVSISDVLVCTDSSGLHIGARLPNTKVIGLFGSTGICDTNDWAHTNYYNNIYPIQSNMACSPCWDWQHDNCRHRWHSPTCLWRIHPRKVFEKMKMILTKSMSADHHIKSDIRCPQCGSAVFYLDGCRVVCKKWECDWGKGGFDHLHFITDTIAVGNCTIPLDHEVLKLCKIGAILSVANDFEHSNQIDLPNIRFGLHDSTNNNMPLFLAAVDQLSYYLTQHNRVLVHCMGGGRRSVAVAAWYLSGGYKDKFWKIVTEFKEVRDAVKLNGGIHDFLEKKEEWKQ